MDQHANTFQARLPGPESIAGGHARNEILETVNETLEILNETGKLSKAVENRTKIRKAVGKSEQTVLTGTALQAWIRDKGFNGKNTAKQRSRLKSKGDAYKKKMDK
jgi:hypothetical protein